MKKLLFVLFCMASFTGFSQDTSRLEVNPAADIVSRYVWRGIDFGASPAVEPDLCFTYKNLEFGAWGAFSTNSDYQELDVYLYYTFYKELFTIGFIDYYFPDVHALNQNYFDFSNETTAHYLELNALFNGSEKLPLSISVNSIIYGADKGVSDSVIIPADSSYSYQFKNLYSTYIELGYQLERPRYSLDFFLGYNLNGIDREDAVISGGEGFYLDGAGITNIGITATRSIKINEKLRIPLYSSFIVNPKLERVYLVFGLSL
ncbi:hypothetical protein ACFLRI_00215 [Bacteroidota bacterium]